MRYVPFGNDTVGLIYDLDLKSKIIDYLFNTFDLKQFRFNMLENIKKDTLKHPEDREHINLDEDTKNPFLKENLVKENKKEDINHAP